MVALLAACGGAVLVGKSVARHLDDRDQGRATARTTTTLVVRPPPGQVLVRGPLQAFAADDVQAPPIPTPLTLTAVVRGEGKATIENALVGGQRTTIFWGGGTPLPITGTGGLEISGSRIDVDDTGAIWSPTGAARPFVPGTYRIGASVAVGEEGLGRPRDSVEFEADDRTVLNATQGVVIKLEPARLHIEGPGRVALTGTFKVVDATRDRDATKVELAGGPYEVDIDPEGATGLEIDATLQGDLRVT